MKNKIILMFSLLLLIVLNTDLQATQTESKRYDDSSIIIKMTGDIKATEDLVDSVDDSIDPSVKDIEVLNPDQNKEGDVLVVDFTNKTDIEKVISDIEKISTVESAQPNYKYKVSAPIQSKDATCDSTGKWHLGASQLNSAPVKSQLTSKPTVEVGVLDSGIKNTHTEFSGKFNSTKSYDFVYGRTSQTDQNGHGTHVAGSIAGTTMGVASNVKLVSYRVLDAKGEGYSSSMISAIYKANRDKVKILNMSLGSDYYDTLMYDAISKYDGLVIAAAGNEGSSYLSFPAGFNLDNIVSVGAFNVNNSRANYSNYNSTQVDLFAPGHNIRSAAISGNSDFICYNGTSMATPMVSASAAMNLANNTTLNTVQMKNAIMDGANDGLTKTTAASKPNLTQFSASKGVLRLSEAFNYTKNTNTNYYNYSGTSAVLTNGVLKLRGTNNLGQLGNGNNINSPTNYFTVNLPESQTVVKYYLTSKNTYIITNQGRLYVTGSNDNNQLSNGSLTSTNHFVEYRRLSPTHKIKSLEFRNYLGIYDENSIYIYINEGKNALYYKLGNYSYTQNSNSLRNYKAIQLVQLTNNRKQAIKYYNQSYGLVSQESYAYNSSGYLSKKISYYYYSTYNRTYYYEYDRLLKKFYQLDTTKNYKRKYYKESIYTISKSYSDYYGDYIYKSKKKSNSTYYYNAGGKLTKLNKYLYNKYGNLKLQNKSNASYTVANYKNGYFSNSLTARYTSTGKKRLYYGKKLSYKNNKVILKRQYYYNKGYLKTNSSGKAYYYKTSYKNNKAYKTYRYQYNSRGKLTNKTKVSTRR